MKIKSNKKGDIPVTILVLGVVALCALAILSFSFSLSKHKQTLRGVEIIQRANSLENNYCFYKKIGLSDNQAREFIGAVYDSELGGTYLRLGYVYNAGFANTEKIEVIYSLDDFCD